MSLSPTHIDGYVEPVIEEVTRTLKWKNRELEIGVSAAKIQSLLATRLASVPAEARAPVVERLRLYGEFLAHEQRAYGASQAFLSSLRAVAGPLPASAPRRLESDGKGKWTFKVGRGRARRGFGRAKSGGYTSW